MEVAGKRALDSGLSTGGFTDCLLQRGAASVLGVDVGYGQVGGVGLRGGGLRGGGLRGGGRANIRTPTLTPTPTPRRWQSACAPTRACA